MSLVYMACSTDFASLEKAEESRWHGPFLTCPVCLPGLPPAWETALTPLASQLRTNTLRLLRGSAPICYLGAEVFLPFMFVS